MGPNDAQRISVIERQGRWMGGGAATALLFGFLLLLVPCARAAVGGAAVLSGIVRDSQGVAQMGALVQVVSGNSITVATAFTDQHGRYIIDHLTPGRYLVRASQTLYVAATRSNLQLHAGSSAVVNLTLAALFDTASWLPAERRGAGEPDDDWKWTLRSSANRPILRFAGDGQTLEISTSARENSRNAPLSMRATIASGDGEFGDGGLHNIVDMRSYRADGTEFRVRADVGTTHGSSAFGPSQQLDAGFERRVGFDGAARTLVVYKANPEILGTGEANGVTVLAIGSAQRFNVADLVEVEAGGTVEGVHAGAFAVASHPFVRLSAHVGGGWTLRYRLATERNVQSFDDLTPGSAEVPVALVRNGHLELERAHHQEVSGAKRMGRGGVELVYFHDALGNTVLSGGGASTPATGAAASVQTGMLVDPVTGTFRTLGRGYTNSGGRLTVSTPLTTGLWIAAEYSVGEALVSETGAGASFVQTLTGTTPKGAQAATVAIKGHLTGLGTQVRASYRWQQARLVSAVDPYSAFADQAYLSCRLRQPIHFGQHLPQGMAATIDVTNLLAEGYRPFLSEDGQTLYFAQAPRTIQAGLSFSF
jgi:hypothetical protein